MQKYYCWAGSQNKWSPQPPWNAKGAPYYFETFLGIVMVPSIILKPSPWNGKIAPGVYKFIMWANKVYLVRNIRQISANMHAKYPDANVGDAGFCCFY